MTTIKEFNDETGIAEQLGSDHQGPVVLVNRFTIAAADEGALIAACSRDAEFMKAQPGYISTQLHKAIGGSSSFLNYAIWESVESFRQAFSSPEFQGRLAVYPASAIVSPHLFEKMAVPGFCVA